MTFKESNRQSQTIIGILTWIAKCLNVYRQAVIELMVLNHLSSCFSLCLVFSSTSGKRSFCTFSTSIHFMSLR